MADQQMKPISQVPKPRVTLIREIGVLSKQNQRYLDDIKINVDALKEAKEYDDPRRILQCHMKYRLLWSLQKETAEKIKLLMQACEMLRVRAKPLSA